MLDVSANIPLAEINRRIAALQCQLAEHRMDAALILQNADLFYLTGTIQQSHLYLPVRGKPLLMVRRSEERARAESPLVGIVGLASPKELIGGIKANGSPLPATLGMELDVLPANLFFGYQRLFPETRIVDVSPLIRRLRAVKSPFEISRMREAGRLADAVAAAAGRLIAEGMSEVELAGHIEAHARRLGHQGLVRMRLWGSELFYGHLMAGATGAVPSFISSPTGGAGLGPSCPQGPSLIPIRRGQPILVDYVFCHRGYLADHARIFSIGPLDKDLLDAHQAMRDVQRVIIAMARPGVRAGDIYAAALAKTTAMGYGDFFMGADSQRVRFVGHGIGTELDEFPFLAEGQDMALEAGMTVAVEPKLVIPGRGVVGIENTFLVTDSGLEKLTHFTEDVVQC
jgi:Xaa-Pro aminopeptidase